MSVAIMSIAQRNYFADSTINKVCCVKFTYAIQNTLTLFKSFSSVHYVLDSCIETYRIILPCTVINIDEKKLEQMQRNTKNIL